MMLSRIHSTGPYTFAQEGHLLPVSRPVPVNGRIPFADFKRLVHRDNHLLEVFDAESDDSDDG